MRKQTLLDFLCVVLVGCDDTKRLVSFTLEMASFSDEFDFDPLRRPVKDLSRTLLNDKDEVTKRVAGTLSQKGCFDILELHDTENSIGMALVLGADYYQDAGTLEERIRLQGKCQLAKLPVADVVWDTDDNDFVVSVTGKEMKVRYRYNAEGYPLGRTTVSRDSTLQVDAKPSADPLKELDYIAVDLLDNHPLGNVKQTYKYGEYANPVNCQLIIIDENARPAVEHRYSIENTIDYC